jgi:hypothetical protein
MWQREDEDPRIMHHQLDILGCKLDRIITLLEKQQQGITVITGVVGLDGKVEFPQCTCSDPLPDTAMMGWCPIHGARYAPEHKLEPKTRD